MTKKIIVFEEIDSSRAWIVFLYLKLGWPVYFFRIKDEILQKAWLKPFLNSNQLRRVDFENRLDFLDGINDTEAFENLPRLYPLFLADNHFLSRFKKIFNDDDIELAFKHFLLRKLSRFYYLNRNLHELFKQYGKLNAKIYFVPFKSFLVYQTVDHDIPDYFYLRNLAKQSKALLYAHENVSFPLWAVSCGYLEDVSRRLQLIGKFLALPVLLWLKSTKAAFPKQKYKHGFMVITPRQFENEVKPVDFLVDGEQIKKDDVLFIPYNAFTAAQIDYLKGKGLHYIVDSQIGFQRKFIQTSFSYIFYFLMNSLSKDIDCLDNGLRIIFYYVKWNSWAEVVELQSLISQNTDGVVQAIVRDILFKKRGTFIWKYMDSASLVNYLVPVQDFYKAKENLFVYIYCDYMVSWSDDNNQAFKTTHSRIGQYLQTGCLWAEHVRLIQEGKIASNLKNILRQNGLKEGMKVVGVFDSTYAVHFMTTYEDGIQFLKGIEHILNQIPELFVVVKEKKSRKVVFKESKAMQAVYETLEQTGRVYFTQNKMSPSEVIALSDAVISFPFTSTGLEALSVGKKALWFDATAKFEKTFYDEVPGLVCHSAKELSARIKELLYQITDQRYENYLKECVVNRCCPFLDGMGITRFRKLLCGDAQAFQECCAQETNHVMAVK